MANNIPQNLKYTKEHDWILVEGDVATIGITDFAQHSLGDVVYVEVPEVGANLDKETPFGVVESIKSVTDLLAPIAGKVIETNEAVVASPELCNSAPYESWLLKLKIKNPAELSELLSPSAYKDLCDKSHA